VGTGSIPTQRSRRSRKSSECQKPRQGRRSER
jgi:hypothetical protein